MESRGMLQRRGLQHRGLARHTVFQPCSQPLAKPARCRPVARPQRLRAEVFSMRNLSMNTGRLQLYLDSANVMLWDQWSRSELFYGFTTNPSILLRDQVPQCSKKAFKVLAQQAFSLGAQELHIQAWGDSASKLYSTGLDIASVDQRVVVKFPITAEGMEAAALMKKNNARVTLTGAYRAHQAVLAAAAGVDYVAPYLGRMNDAGIYGFDEVARMQGTVRGLDSRMRVLVASIRAPDDLSQLAAQGCDTFTVPPEVADAMFGEGLTLAAAAQFEKDAALLGAA